MLLIFDPRYTITSDIASDLMEIATLKERVLALPMTPVVMAHLRNTAKLYTTHYSTAIEGNRLTINDVRDIVEHDKQIPHKKHDELEIRGYYQALTQVEQWVARGRNINEKDIQTIHALVMAGGRARVKPTPYRDGQNVIRQGGSGNIVYMPPEAQDVQGLMRALVAWINDHSNVPVPLIAAIAHYQFVTIHPYYDGNGRTARLLASYILHLGGYDLKGLYSLEEYYARDLGSYYDALNIGPSHNYYLGRAEADITSWISYFMKAMVVACDHVVERMQQAMLEGQSDLSEKLKDLDLKKRKAMELFLVSNTVTARQVGALFGFKPRTSAHICKLWVTEGFFEIVNSSNKNRTYALSSHYKLLLKI